MRFIFNSLTSFSCSPTFLIFFKCWGMELMWFFTSINIRYHVIKILNEFLKLWIFWLFSSWIMLKISIIWIKTLKLRVEYRLGLWLSLIRVFSSFLSSFLGYCIKNKFILRWRYWNWIYFEAFILILINNINERNLI